MRWRKSAPGRPRIPWMIIPQRTCREVGVKSRYLVVFFQDKLVEGGFLEEVENFGKGKQILILLK